MFCVLECQIFLILLIFLTLNILPSDILPIQQVFLIYAQENGEGMFFDGNSENLSDSKERPNLTILD